MGDERVRKAISYSVNRKGLLKLCDDLLPHANGLLAPGMLGYDDNTKNYSYDLSQAKTLIANAGFKVGFDTKIVATHSPLDPARVDISFALSAMLNKIKVNAPVEVWDFPRFRSSSWRNG